MRTVSFTLLVYALEPGQTYLHVVDHLLSASLVVDESFAESVVGLTIVPLGLLTEPREECFAVGERSDTAAQGGNRK